MTSELLYGLFLILHLASGAALALRAMRRRLTPSPTSFFLLFRAPELLLSIGAVLFLFSYIYATNANMDYVQRFMASHGNLRLAPNSTQERLNACLRFLPFLAVDAAWYLYFRLRKGTLARRALGGGRCTHIWALPLSMLSGILYALAFPSFMRTAGLPPLGWVCLVPLLLCLSEVPAGWGIMYGTFAGVLQTMISNYWLGTFNLLTLQFVSLITALEYVPFMAVSLLILRRSRGAGFIVFPAAWTVFDWLRSMGFLGYPWGMLGASQYSVIPVIQISSLTGVWGVTFLLVLCNSVVAWYGGRAAGGVPARRGAAPALVLAVACAFTLGWAGWNALIEARKSAVGAKSVRLALIQQNDDPRKNDYRLVFDTLRSLTDRALAARPDLVVWSETAFVPNIRRWSHEDPAVYPLAALVRDFLAYQKTIGKWLLTGNDDYSLITQNGTEERLDYNGSVLFSPQGTRVETYHKIHLVPFTEYFPFKKQLPGIYRLLMSFDAYLWEPGDRRVVFHHPLFAFSTPICFEDVFPNDVRRFVREGAEVILNLSNDYWSLTEAEGMQHAANAVFRAVENGRPIARAAASGLTCMVDPHGRITARSPFYTESFLIVDVPLSSSRQTLYTRWGDWFPASLAVLVFLLAAWSFAWPRPE
ncbi:MAG TPA: apolipoprotein N-acyltransferase [Spirochaetia bacterium]|nr:apolipoprotein N-acyltransferase [Spirochaetia bacterium]